MEEDEQFDEYKMGEVLQSLLPDLEFRDDAIYENRAIAFLDILGFSSMVVSSSSDIEKQGTLKDLLQEI